MGLTHTLLTTVLLASAAAQGAGDAQTATTLTSLVTAELSNDARFDVLSSADVRQVVAFEAEKQALGCTDDSSCLAEVAGAMGARYVVYGQLGRLGSIGVLTLNLFDSDKAQAISRSVVQAPDVEQFATKLPAAVASLVADVAVAEGAQAKLLVLDVAPTAPADAGEPPPAVTASEGSGGLGVWFLVGGGAAGALGALAATGGVLMGLAALGTEEEARTTPFYDDAKQALDDAERYALISNALYITAGVLVVGGVALAAGSLFVEGE
jgi:hypothetical protein